MKIHQQDHAQLQALAEKLEHVRAAMLTRVSPQGQLYSHPMTPLEMDRHGAIWFFASRASQRTQAQAQAAEPASLAFTDASRSDYVSISGSLELLQDSERARQLWSPMAKPWFPEGPESPDLVMLRFVPENAEFWDSPDSKVVRMLALTASVVAGRPIGLGTHERLDALPADEPV